MNKFLLASFKKSNACFKSTFTTRLIGFQHTMCRNIVAHTQEFESLYTFKNGKRE